jgi:hypothetical protein
VNTPTKPAIAEAYATLDHFRTAPGVSPYLRDAVQRLDSLCDDELTAGEPSRELTMALSDEAAHVAALIAAQPCAPFNEHQRAAWLVACALADLRAERTFIESLIAADS